MRRLKKLLTAGLYTSTGIAWKIAYRVYTHLENKRKEDPTYRTTYYDHIHNE